MEKHKWKNNICVNCGLKRKKKRFKALVNEDDFKSGYKIKSGFQYIDTGNSISFGRPECIIKVNNQNKKTTDIMNLSPVYYAVIFDKALPQTIENAQNKVVTKEQWKNLIDGNTCKQLQLPNEHGDYITYNVVSIQTFSIHNSTYNPYYVIVVVEKVK